MIVLLVFTKFYSVFRRGDFQIILIARSVKQAAEYPNIKVVNLDWILESFERQTKTDEKAYLMTTSDSTVAQADTTVSKLDSTIKRLDSTVTKSDSTVMKSDSAAAKPDSAATTKNNDKGKKRTREESIKEEHSDVDKADAPPATKKQKDGLKAKAKSLTIPVDEGCSLAGEKCLKHRKFQTDR